MAANYVLWPFAHFVNFRFVPNEHRILYNNVVAVRSPAAAACLAAHSRFAAEQSRVHRFC